MKIATRVKVAVILALLMAVGAPVFAADETVVVPSGVALTRVTKKVTPTYPPAAQQLKLRATIEIEVTVSPDGDVENATLAKGNPIFGPNTLAAVKQWKFQPFIKDGKAVKAQTTIPFNFSPN